MKFRPIEQGDFEWFRVPPISRSAIGWVLVDPMPVGFTAIDSVPGLPHLADLYLYILPSQREMGYGRKLLEHSIREATERGYKQLSTIVENEQSLFAGFMKAQNFYTEHVEVTLKAEIPAHCPPTLETLVTLPDDVTYSHLRKLYDDSFGATKWYQPFASDHDVYKGIEPDHVIYYLKEGQEVIGFALVEYSEGQAEIEPFGIVASKQGRGFGRILLKALFHEFSRKNITHVELSTWSNNLPALALYQSFGFEGQSTRTFLAYDL